MHREIHTFDNGVKVYADHLIPVQRERYRHRNVHEAEEEDLFVGLIGDIAAPGCYINIGSAIGYYPILARKLAPELEIHAVEPLRSHRRYFQENIRLNGMSPRDFILHKTAVASLAGRVKFRDKGFGSAIERDRNRIVESGPVSWHDWLQAVSRLLGRAPLSGEDVLLDVKTVTLDQLLDSIGHGADLVQMDVQGLELEVLRGGIKSLQGGRVQTFLIGTHGRKLHADCLGMLLDHGYNVTFDNFETQHQPDGILVASK